MDGQTVVEPAGDGRLARLRAWGRATRGRRGARRILSIVLAVLAALVIALTVIVAYVDDAALDPDQFANRATSALQTESVRNLIASEITGAVVLRANRDLVGFRPVIESAVSAIVGSPPFRDLFRRAVTDVHRSVFTNDSNTVTLSIADALVLVDGALKRIAPQMARRLERQGPTIDLRIDAGSDSIDIAKTADGLRSLVPWLAALAALLVAAAALVSVDRRRTAIVAGASVAVLGLALIAAWQLGRALTLDRLADADARAAAGAVWDAYLIDLRTALLIFAGAGAVVAASASSLLRPVEIGGPLRRAWLGIVRVPDRPALATLQAALLIVVGALVIVDRRATLDVALFAAGIFLLYTGVERLLRLIVAPRAELAGAAASPASAAVSRRRTGLRAGIAGAVALSLIGGAVAIFLGSGGTSVARPPITACNGSAALCDRPWNEVAFPATHNSMSSADTRGFLLAQQERDIPDQLADGIRGLLIDTHYGRRTPGGRVKTDLGPIGSAQRKKFEAEIGPEALDAALRIRDRLGFQGESGPREVFLCHAFCELGEIPFKATLSKIRDFLVTHPDEVIVLDIEDGGVAPADVVEAVRESGLERLVYRGRMTRPFPTLRWMIEHDQRAVVMAEEHAGAAPWYRRAYDYMQETPYSFKRPALLTKRRNLRASCRPNRGPADAPLFLLNSWIDTTPQPKPSNAAKVNDYDALLRRARTCERIRHRFPNLIAVDFYRTGDLFKVARTLNRSGPQNG